MQVARTGMKRKAQSVLIEKSEGKRPLRKPIIIWGDDIKMDIKEISCESQWRRCLSHGSAATHLLGLRTRNLRWGHRCLSVVSVCVFRLVTRTEQSYRAWCV